LISAIQSIDEGQKSLVLYRDGSMCIQEQAAFDLIQAYYKEHLVCYEGGRRISCEVLKIRQKAPVSLSIDEQIVFFPSHGSTHPDCTFINAANVRSVKSYRKKETKVEFFRNYVILPIGVRSIKTQMQRCELLMNRKTR